MLALIMAGGQGSRLNLGEKPLVSVGGKPMIARIIDAFRSSGCDVVVVASDRNPMTRNWCRTLHIDMILSEGLGYIEDMVAAVTDLEETGPLFVSVSDIPCINADIISRIRTAYDHSGKEACSTWIPVALARNSRDPDYVERVDDTDAYPAGINILRGDIISRPQDEFRLLLADKRLAYNINTRSDLACADEFFRMYREERFLPGRSRI